MPAPLALLGLAALGALLFGASSSSSSPASPAAPSDRPFGLGPNDVTRRPDGTFVATAAAQSDALAKFGGYRLEAEPRVGDSVALHRLVAGVPAGAVSAKDAILQMRAQRYDTWLLPAAVSPNGLPAFAFVPPGSGVAAVAWVLLFPADEPLPASLPAGFSPNDYWFTDGVVKAKPALAQKTLADLDRAHLESAPGIEAKRMIVAGATLGKTALAEAREAHGAGKDIWLTADLLIEGPARARNPALVFLAPADRPKNLVPGAFVLLLGASDPWPEGLTSYGAEFEQDPKTLKVSPTKRAIVEARALLALWFQTETSFSHGLDALPSDFGVESRPLDLTSDVIDVRMEDALRSFIGWLAVNESVAKAMGVPEKWSTTTDSPLTPWVLDALVATGAAIAGAVKGGKSVGAPNPDVTVMVPLGEKREVTILPNKILSIILVAPESVSLAQLSVFADGSVKQLNPEWTPPYVPSQEFPGTLQCGYLFSVGEGPGSVVMYVPTAKGNVATEVKVAASAAYVAPPGGQLVAEDAATRSGTYVVRKGDTPAYLANYYTGDPKRFAEIGPANPTLGSLVRRGTRVNFAGWKPGVRLTLPSSWNAARKPPPGLGSK